MTALKAWKAPIVFNPTMAQRLDFAEAVEGRDLMRVLVYGDEVSARTFADVLGVVPYPPVLFLDYDKVPFERYRDVGKEWFGPQYGKLHPINESFVIDYGKLDARTILEIPNCVIIDEAHCLRPNGHWISAPRRWKRLQRRGLSGHSSGRMSRGWRRHERRRKAKRRHG